MLPSRLVEILRDIENRDVRLQYNRDDNVVFSGENENKYPVIDDVPSIMRLGPENEEWNAWDMDMVHKIGDSYYKRAKGELPEKEASKSFANILRDREIYSKGDSILDIGCATGHFLRSFRRVLGPDVIYTGIDSHLDYLLWGSEIYGVDETCAFVHSDALELPFADKSFDISIVNLFHFFEDIESALKELIRVTGRTLLWRAPVGETNYATKVIYDNNFEDIGLITPERRDINYTLYMMFSKQYLEGLVKHLSGKPPMFIAQDTDFEEFDNTALSEFDGLPSTKVVNGMQINGNLILDWHYVAIDCSD